MTSLFIGATMALANPGGQGMAGYTGGNMNGKYSVWSGEPNAKWNDDYASKGYEYFDVYAPEMATYYGQVFWTDQGNVPIPPDVVARFKNKTMAIVGYEQDQVMVTPQGKPGVNPEQDVSVPINWAYNHHYMAWMTGAHSETRVVDAKEGDDYYANGAHGQKTVMKAFDLPSAAFRSGDQAAIPTSQMFSEGNGGESRKSFHGYPSGYAQLIDSPEFWHITPMQIDTRNRDCGVMPGDVHKCTKGPDGYPLMTPGIEPRQARYGRGIPAGGTNYSGVLECPCNGGYGGDPQFYKAHPEAGNNTKSIDHAYSAIGSGTCDKDDHVASAQECFDAMGSLGISAVKVTNTTTADATKPFGCSVTTATDGSVAVMFNTAGNTPCAASTTKVAAVDTKLGVTMAIQLEVTPGKTMSHSAKGVFCSSNHVDGNVLAAFPSHTLTNVTALEAALAACDAFCLASAACTACSVDDNTDSQWVALKSCGPETKFAGHIAGDVSTKASSGVATITLNGPADAWFGIGFNAVVMSNAPYTILVNSTNVWEQKIGTCGSEAEHCPGDLLAPELKVVSSTTKGNVRTVVLTRPLAGATNKHYSFSFDKPTINIISAVGQNQVFAYHKMHTALALTLTSPPGVATCVCDEGAEGELCNSGGTNCAKFTKNCVAAPQGSLLQQDNPTCNSRQYVGGLSCCHHARVMLDEDQSPGTGAQLKYHMKWRFWYQTYEPNATKGPRAGTGKPSHYDLPRIYYQTEANAGEYDIPPAFSLPGNPVAGYANWPLNKMTPGTSCTGTCPGGPDCECIHTIEYHWTMSNTRLVYAGGHCHAPACVSIELYMNTSKGPELICRQLPAYGTGDIVNDKYDEADYLALPPCLWSKDDEGLIAGVWIPPNTPMYSVKKNRNTIAGHFGEMASWQMRGVTFQE